MEYRHTPVMLKEVMEYLKPQPGNNYIDCTLGGGGYTNAILESIGEAANSWRLTWTRWQSTTLRQILKNKFHTFQDNFKNLLDIAKKTLAI